MRFRVAPVWQHLPQTFGQPDPAIDLPQQEHPAIAGDLPTAEVGLNFSAAKAWKFDGKRLTVCHVAKSPVGLGLSSSTLAGYPKDFATFLPP
jgi:hypothetical protein